MLAQAKSILKAVARRILPEGGLSFAWHRRDPESWIVRHLPWDTARFAETDRDREIERIAARVNEAGAQPLWDGYRIAYQKDGSIPWAAAAMERTPDQVRIGPQLGRLFARIAEQRKPNLIVEIGTAFGISAMYWASGLQRAGGGRLLTFEPNEVWHRIAADHLKAFGDVVTPVLGTFEDHIDAHRGTDRISLAFVDAIHTGAVVDAQMALILERLEPHGIAVLDDITFSDDMRACWARWAEDPRVRASVAVDQRVGLLEF